jgi:hypothetical protein
MNHFAEELKTARLAAGYKTASAFFEWLKRKGVSFNYSYYMRLEKGGLPSEKVVTELAATFEKDWADRLILAYCRALFPRHAYLFPQPEAHEDFPQVPVSVEPASSTPYGQKELSPRQVAILAASEDTYHLFLLCTLARRGIEEKELDRWFSAKAMNHAIKSLSSAGLLTSEGRKFERTSMELRFPDSYTAELKEAYAKFDVWDESFGRKFSLDQIVNKMLIRRVSGRYVSLVRKQLDLLFELTKTSDEVDDRYNENVLQLMVSLRQGKLPG